MTHRTRAAPALTVSASWLHKSHVARLQARPRQDRKGITAGSIPTGHWDSGPSVQTDTQCTPEFSTLKSLNETFLRLQYPLCCLIAHLELRCSEAKVTKGPRRQGMCLVSRSVGIWLHHFLAAGVRAGFSSKLHILVFKRRC